ncbi:helix-turn-helix domain-containing protein, partial [Gibbsiella quercinecans]
MQRLQFVTACLKGDTSVAELCRRFNISRKTGYKWLSRFS